MKFATFRLLLCSLLFAGCAAQNTYLINGTVSRLDGDTVYLKVFQDDALRTLDSRQLTHGRFSFSGAIDSIVLAHIFLDDNSLIPFVLEDGDITLRIDDNICTAEGTPLNDSLSTFLRSYMRLEAAMAELPLLETRMILDGVDLGVARAERIGQMKDLEEQRDMLVSGFIQRNYSNLLGPSIFRMMTTGMPQPVLTPLIITITNGAPPTFLNDPYVKDFLRRAAGSPY